MLHTILIIALSIIGLIIGILLLSAIMFVVNLKLQLNEMVPGLSFINQLKVILEFRDMPQKEKDKILVKTIHENNKKNNN